VTAGPFGYAATALVIMALARLLPGGPLQASVAAGLLAFPLYAALVIYIFAAVTARRAFLVTVAVGVAGGALAWAMALSGARP
jgi:hypothetical protein